MSSVRTYKLCELEEPVSPILCSDLSFIYGENYQKKTQNGQGSDSKIPAPAIADSASKLSTTRSPSLFSEADDSLNKLRVSSNLKQLGSDRPDNHRSERLSNANLCPPSARAQPSSFVTPCNSRLVTPCNSRLVTGSLWRQFGSGNGYTATPALRVRIAVPPSVDTSLEDERSSTSDKFDINSLRVRKNILTEVTTDTGICDEIHSAKKSIVVGGDYCSTPAAPACNAPPAYTGRYNLTPAPWNLSALDTKCFAQSLPKVTVNSCAALQSPPTTPVQAMTPEEEVFVTAAGHALDQTTIEHLDHFQPPASPIPKQPVVVGSNWKVPRIEGPKADNVIRVNGKLYHSIKIIGEGGSCKVHEVYDSKRQLRAIKCVKLTGREEDKYFLNEIALLEKLQGSNRVIKLYDYEHNVEKGFLYVVMERGDVSLDTLIRSTVKRGQITDTMIKFYWSEMLRAVQIIHHEGVIHSDLKPPNFLIVEGQLKLIDFGISSSIPDDLTSVFKDGVMGTPSYMSPEALTGDTGDWHNATAKPIKIGVKSDVWSLGCILYHIVHGCTPFSHIRHQAKLFHAILSPEFSIPFPPISDPLLADVLKKCIVRDPKKRASIDELLNHPFLIGSAADELKPNKTVESLMRQISELSPNSMKKISQVVNQMNISNNP